MTLIKQKYNQEDKQRARVTLDELNSMIEIVLKTGDSGTKIIKRYAEKHGKSDQWRKDIAKQRATKLFESVLNEYEEHEVILELKKNKSYSKRDILNNNSITGALRQLAKQVSNHNNLVIKNRQIAQLQERLALKKLFVNKPFDKDKAQELRDDGLTIREIADIMNAKRSTVHKHTKGKSKG
ncbi:hypothetical protein Q9L42_020270 (plasmid) [Methylomarinum sp. Ch1-1]|uniref:Helix-turn-helix domain-containing protein n=1 Tax=Methylomarinum roseum TaxID=3067653 RepID=A0AAU7P034_9GAMM|nr:hypothetical protein [Methylomarinum sp. Ch1-1]MDP4523250.1 hypothetical protein [Methylomarinum sp. Ch1-1]